MRRALIAASACLFLGSAALAAELPMAAPSEVGMSRLERLTRFFLNGVRLLSRKTVELMASDHLGPALSQGPNFAPGPGYGFGLTMAVRTQPGMFSCPGSVGEFNWGGAAGTAFWPARVPRPGLPGDQRPA